MTAGSGIFSTAHAVNDSLVMPGKSGFAGEIGDLRSDVAAALAPLAALTVEEFTQAPLGTATQVMQSTPSTAAERTLLPAVTPAAGALVSTELAKLAAGGPRQLLFTIGSTAAQGHTTAAITGTDARDQPQVEVVTLPLTATTVLSGKFFKSVAKIVLAAGTGTGATMTIGFGTKIGLAQKPKKRAGRVAVIQEVWGGTVLATGTVATADDGTAATVTGTVDLVTAVPVMPTTETLIVEINGVSKTVTFASPTDLAAIITQVNAICGAGFAAAGGVGSKYLTLLSPTTGYNSTIKIGAGTANTKLGFVATTLYRGVGNGVYGSYTPASALGSTDAAITYECDPTV